MRVIFNAAQRASNRQFSFDKTRDVCLLVGTALTITTELRGSLSTLDDWESIASEFRALVAWLMNLGKSVRARDAR